MTQADYVKEPIVLQCAGCTNVCTINRQNVCAIYYFPHVKWRLGNCPSATNLVKAVTAPKKQLNPLKASKRSRKQKRV